MESLSVRDGKLLGELSGQFLVSLVLGHLGKVRVDGVTVQVHYALQLMWGQSHDREVSYLNKSLSGGRINAWLLASSIGSYW